MNKNLLKRLEELELKTIVMLVELDDLQLEAKKMLEHLDELERKNLYLQGIVNNYYKKLENER